MKRRAFLTGLFIGGACVGAGLPTALLAAGPSELILAQMRASGFGNILVETTFLGRVRIFGTKANTSREVVLNPRTGEILRDVTRMVGVRDTDSVRRSNSGGSSGGSSGNERDGDRDGRTEQHDGSDHDGGDRHGSDHDGSDRDGSDRDGSDHD